MKKVICIVGPVGAGKDEVAKYLARKYNAFVFSSQFFKPILQKLNLVFSRENMFNLFSGLDAVFGKEAVAEFIYKVGVKSGKEIFVISGFREVEDYLYFKKTNTILIYIDADVDIRYKRVVNRREKSDEFDLTMESFLERENKGKEKHVLDFKKYADIVIANNFSDTESLYKKIDEILQNIGSQ